MCLLEIWPETKWSTLFSPSTQCTVSDVMAMGIIQGSCMCCTGWKLKSTDDATIYFAHALTQRQAKVCENKAEHEEIAMVRLRVMANRVNLYILVRSWAFVWKNIRKAIHIFQQFSNCERRWIMAQCKVYTNTCYGNTKSSGQRVRVHVLEGRRWPGQGIKRLHDFEHISHKRTSIQW